VPRNPPWTDGELVLALNLYQREPRARNDKGDIALAALSRELRARVDLALMPDPTRYRNLNSVYLKLQNFKAIDPNYPGVGMAAGATARAQRIWDTYSDDPAALAAAVSAIRTGEP
jgi:5-methylcytosine-specific restriction protein A